MAKTEQEASAVAFSDKMEAGMNAAMDRVKELGLEAGTTLVDKFSKAEWSAWDACGENALVIDSDGLDGGGDIDDALEALGNAA